MWRETNCGIDVVNERPHVSREPIITAGSCMGCSRSHRVVGVLKSTANCEIRLCSKCIKELRSVEH